MGLLCREPEHPSGSFDVHISDIDCKTTGDEAGRITSVKFTGEVDSLLVGSAAFFIVSVTLLSRVVSKLLTFTRLWTGQSVCFWHCHQAVLDRASHGLAMVCPHTTRLGSAGPG